MADSSIEWTGKTWNPVSGCTIISPGCTNCYAMRMAYRCEAMGHLFYQNLTRKSGDRIIWNGRINLGSDHELNRPFTWEKPTKVFVNSMSDLFHVDVPLPFIQRVFGVMNQTRRHTYQVLTKRADNLQSLSNKLPWSSNIWMGVSVENSDYTWRIDALRQTQAHIKFLSLEPLLSPLDDLNLTDIDWVIVGGESGLNARPMRPEWARSIQEQCQEAGTKFFFKQWGGVNKKATGRLLDGRTWDEYPEENNALLL